MNDWANTQNPDFSNLSVSDAIRQNDNWHRHMVESGSGKKYNDIDTSKIVYGPNNWQDPENNGHIILELNSKNDLEVEGFLQLHCVGGHDKKVQDKQCRIFSLRNIKNMYQPILTIETDMSGAIVRQDYGKRNSKIDKKYHDMVTEWSSKRFASEEIDYSNLSREDILCIKLDETLSKIVDKTNDVVVLRHIAHNQNASDETLSKIVDKTNELFVLKYIAYDMHDKKVSDETKIKARNKIKILQAKT